MDRVSVRRSAAWITVWFLLCVHLFSFFTRGRTREQKGKCKKINTKTDSACL